MKVCAVSVGNSEQAEKNSDGELIHFSAGVNRVSDYRIIFHITISKLPESLNVSRLSRPSNPSPSWLAFITFLQVWTMTEKYTIHRIKTYSL